MLLWCDPISQEGALQAKLISEWMKLTNKERKRYRVEAQVAKARAEAEMKREVKDFVQLMRTHAPTPEGA